MKNGTRRTKVHFGKMSNCAVLHYYMYIADIDINLRWWTILNPLKALQYHVCDLTALICLATIVADSSFPALQRLARLGLIQVSVAAAVRHNHNSEEKAFDEERRKKKKMPRHRN